MWILVCGVSLVCGARTRDRTDTADLVAACYRGHELGCPETGLLRAKVGPFFFPFLKTRLRDRFRNRSQSRERSRIAHSRPSIPEPSNVDL